MYDVVVAGAGPVGMTLGLDLAWRGVTARISAAMAAASPPASSSAIRASSVASRICRTASVSARVSFDHVDWSIPPYRPSSAAHVLAFRASSCRAIAASPLGSTTVTMRAAGFFVMSREREL